MQFQVIPGPFINPAKVKALLFANKCVKAVATKNCQFFSPSTIRQFPNKSARVKLVGQLLLQNKFCDK